MVNTPDYPASRSSDLGDTDPLFDPPPEKNDSGAGGDTGMNGFGGGMGGELKGGMGGGMGMAAEAWAWAEADVMNVSGQPDSPPILRQQARGRRGGPRATGAWQARPRLDFDSLINCITSIIQPTTWDAVGGPGSIAPLASQQLLVVHQTRDVQEKVANFLDTLRHRVETRPQIRIEAHWLWLTEPELASLLTEQDQGEPLGRRRGRRGRLEEVAATERDDAGDAAGDFVEMRPSRRSSSVKTAN